MRPIIIVFVSLITFGIIPRELLAQEQSTIYGSWQNDQFGYQMNLILNADGSGNFDGESLHYNLDGQILKITINGLVTEYTYGLNGNTLSLMGGDLEGLINFTRSIAEPISSPATTESGQPTFSLTDSSLIGLWSGNGEMIDFKGDGNCKYLGTIYSYQVSQGHIIINTNPGTVSFQYTVNQGQLTLTANGTRAVYWRPDGSMKENKSQPGQRIALELVGTWCYLNMLANSQSSRCITLNEDGTYIYEIENSRSVNTTETSGGTTSQGSDSGTWFLKEDRIYYNSQTNGQGFYKLEKRNHPKNVSDPMIVLDGDPFVTTVQRPPWR